MATLQYACSGSTALAASRLTEWERSALSSSVQQIASPFARPSCRIGVSSAAAHGVFTSSARAASASSDDSLDTGGKARRRELVRVHLSKNGATNAVARTSTKDMEAKELVEVVEVGKQFSLGGDGKEQGIISDGVPLTTAPSCALPNFSTCANTVTLLNPLGLSRDPNEGWRPMLLYVPGMDCTGQGISSQLCYLVEAGYDVRCVYIPSTDRSSWQQLVDLLLPLVMKEVQGVNGKTRHLTVLGESFGGGLAMRLAKAAPSLVTRLVLINPATNFPANNFLGSLAARTGLLATFPKPVYEIAQDILLPLMVKRNRVSTAGTEDFLSPMDFVPATCASWRLSMLNDYSGLDDKDLSLITMPTLLIVSGKDRILSSMTEGARLQRMLPIAKRVVLPESGHTALFEDSVNIVDIMLANGFTHPSWADFSPPLHSNVTPRIPVSPVAKREEAVADDVMDELGRFLEPWRVLTSPFISGAENLPMPSSEPRRPLLLVGNHCSFGIYDSPILVYELYLRGFRCRGLAHPGHWITGVGSIFERYGNVKATKVAAYRLLKERENVLLFPGGAREVCKGKGEQYKLFWRETADFVRLAIRHKAIIIPFGALGGDEAYDILYDANEIRASPIWPLVEQAYKRVGIDPDNIYPITALPGTKIPSPLAIPSTIERIYFHFADPIDTNDCTSYINDREQVHITSPIAHCWHGIGAALTFLVEQVSMQSLYETVKASVEGSIELLKDIRFKDPERELPIRLMAKLGRLLPEFLPRIPSSKFERPSRSG